MDLEKIIASITRVGVACDLDETVADTNNHWIATLVELYGKPDDITHADIARTYRYVEHVPWWQTQEAQQWMEWARHSSDGQEGIPPIEDAVRTLAHVHAVVPIVAYITARPENVRFGTERWLANLNHCFPEAPVIMRPERLSHEGGNMWKAGVLAALYPKVRGIIDDNPGLVEHLPHNYPGTVFLYNHDQFEHPSVRVVAVKTWADVLPAVTLHLG